MKCVHIYLYAVVAVGNEFKTKEKNTIIYSIASSYELIPKSKNELGVKIP